MFRRQRWRGKLFPVLAGAFLVFAMVVLAGNVPQTGGSSLAEARNGVIELQGEQKVKGTKRAGQQLPASQQNHTVIYTYDEAGRLVGATYSNGVRITYTYDKAGNLLRREVVEPTPTATPTPTLTRTPTPTLTPTATSTPVARLYLPIVHIGQ